MTLGDTDATLRAVALVVVVTVLPASSVGQQDEAAVDSGVIERAGVTLTLLDIDATDKAGRPLPGLSAEDFKVRLNGRVWPIYSVDDLCSCLEPGPSTAESDSAVGLPPGTEPGAPDPSATARERDPYAPTPNRFVIYFDFSQLQLDGRERAAQQARRWLRESMRQGDEALVAAFSTAAGLRELSRFSANREELLAIVDEAYAMREMIDPFPEGFDTRQRDCSSCCHATCPEEFGCGWCERVGWQCVDCCPICSDHASDEYFHGRRSLKALRRLLMDLQDEPGRKHLMLFHQNGNLYPARFYPVREALLGDHLDLLDAVAAEATLGRTVVHAAYSGEDSNLYTPLSSQAVNFSANIADMTAGTYNRGPDMLATVLDGAGRACECIYRIAVVPPDKPSGAIYRVKVKAAGNKLPLETRIRFVDEVDRWKRDAEAVLANPEIARDLTVRAELLPVHAGNGRWNVAAQVALELDTLLPLPAAEGKHEGRWEVGALLTRDGERSWEMLAVSRALWERRESGRTVVHTHGFTKLRPGRYRLATFVRDHIATVFGASEVALELPETDRTGIVGPIVMYSSEQHLAAPLPLADGETAEAVAVSEIRAGPVPAGQGPVPPGRSITLVSFLCGKGARPASEQVVRYVSKDDTPLFKFERARVEPVGSCTRVVDVVETWRLAEGDYDYHLIWTAAAVDDLTATVRFAVSAGAVEASRPADPAPLRR